MTGRVLYSPVRSVVEATGIEPVGVEWEVPARRTCCPHDAPAAPVEYQSTGAATLKLNCGAVLRSTPSLPGPTQRDPLTIPSCRKVPGITLRADARLAFHRNGQPAFLLGMRPANSSSSHGDAYLLLGRRMAESPKVAPTLGLEPRSSVLETDILAAGRCRRSVVSGRA